MVVTTKWPIVFWCVVLNRVSVSSLLTVSIEVLTIGVFITLIILFQSLPCLQMNFRNFPTTSLIVKSVKFSIAWSIRCYTTLTAFKYLVLLSFNLSKMFAEIELDCCLGTPNCTIGPLTCLNFFEYVKFDLNFM